MTATEDDLASFARRGLDALAHVLICPDDAGPLVAESAPALGAHCAVCGRRFPVIDGVLSVLADVELDDVTRREQASRDAEAEWYHGIFADYTNLVEVPATVDNVGYPVGPILDLGAGTGRVTTHLAQTRRQPVVALDYSLASLRLLARHCERLDTPVLAVHADARQLPLRDASMAAAVSAEVYEHFRAGDRHTVLREIERVLRPGAPLSISSLNFNLTFRAWQRRGNPGAKEGDHMFGSDFYYVRQTPQEFRDELAQVFVVDRVVGVRNIPARSLSAGAAKLAGERGGDAVLGFMTRRGYHVDRFLARTPLSKLTGFFLLAAAHRRP